MLEGTTRRQFRSARTGREFSLLDWGGDGPPALLHHANGFCAALWDGVAQLLRDSIRVIAMDARGHGDSQPSTATEGYGWSDMADDVVEVAEHVLEDLGRDRLHLGMGHSFGGTLTLTAASRRPELYERIMLVDPVILPPMDRSEATQRVVEIGLAERSRRRRHTWPTREEARSYFESKPLCADWTPEALDVYVCEGLRDRPDGQVELKCAGAVEAAIFESGPGFDIFAIARGSATPTRMLWAQGGNFPRVVYEHLVKTMENADVENVKGGHLIPMEDPDRVARAAKRFIRDIP